MLFPFFHPASIKSEERFLKQKLKILTASPSLWGSGESERDAWKLRASVCVSLLTVDWLASFLSDLSQREKIFSFNEAAAAGMENFHTMVVVPR